MGGKECCCCRGITDVQPYKDEGDYCWDCRSTLLTADEIKRRRETERREESEGIRRFII